MMELYDISMMSPCVRAVKLRRACSKLKYIKAQRRLYENIDRCLHSLRIRNFEKVDMLGLKFDELAFFELSAGDTDRIALI